MKRNKRKYGYVALIILSAIMAGVLFIAERQAQVPDYLSLWKNMALSVLCSIIASAVFSLLQDAGNEDMETKLNEINENLKLQRELYDSGIEWI